MMVPFFEDFSHNIDLSFKNNRHKSFSTLYGYSKSVRMLSTKNRIWMMRCRRVDARCVTMHTILPTVHTLWEGEVRVCIPLASALRHKQSYDSW
jgi:hypothetical protein